MPPSLVSVTGDSPLRRLVMGCAPVARQTDLHGPLLNRVSDAASLRRNTAALIVESFPERCPSRVFPVTPSLLGRWDVFRLLRPFRHARLRPPLPKDPRRMAYPDKLRCSEIFEGQMHSSGRRNVRENRGSRRSIAQRRRSRPFNVSSPIARLPWLISMNEDTASPTSASGGERSSMNRSSQRSAARS